jgi:type III restriction enzyme
MKIQFDAQQQYQLDAVAAVVDIFEGQPLQQPEYSVVYQQGDTGLFAGQVQTEVGVGNQLLLSDDLLRKNTRAIQERNEIDIANGGAPLEGWPLVGRQCPHFSVEMETGTGKTYVYLRTIYELATKYGFRKFIIVVPSVAIREGVLKNIDITGEHFKALYNLEPQSFVYDGKKVSRLRQFATSNNVEILIINIDAFRKNFTDSEDERKSNVIYKESDKLSGRQPIEFVQATNPIVILDEPQSVDSTPKSQEAIKALNPLCTLRYSATHRNPYNLVYRLDPIRAYELRLVKQIVVDSATTPGSQNNAYLRVEKIEYKNGVKAKLRFQVQTPNGPREKSLTVKNGSDLYELSDNRAAYRDGFIVTEIDATPGAEFVRFDCGIVLSLGQEQGGVRDEIWQSQIRKTVKKHLDKELQVRALGLKVLSLFFIDRVANYRTYEGNETGRGKFAAAFEQALAELAAEPKYKSLEWLKLPVESLHKGYFSEDKKHVLKDTSGSTQADDDTYNLIMKDKETLLSLDTPLRFIFSHSALREGWDNPNVFQICTLNETQSATKKRQEIGRGLRLPVNQDGQRVFDEAVNKLYVVANESYEDFARALQEEYEEDCGVTFGKVPIQAFAKIAAVVDEQEKPLGRDESKTIWNTLVTRGFLAADGRLQPSFEPRRSGFTLQLPEAYQQHEAAVIDVLASYQIERHIRQERDERKNVLRKEVVASADFQELWSRIKPRTTYRVEFGTDELVMRAVSAVRAMPKIEQVEVHFTTAELQVTRGGVKGEARAVSTERIAYRGPLPDLLAYLQGQTELTRSTLVRILKGSGRLPEFFLNPQRYMDAVAATLKAELHRLIVDGIKYERISSGDPDFEWQMELFKQDEIINYLTSIQVQRSVYEYVVYDSEVEREFAKRLNERTDIRLFLKLPGGFEIDTPVGKYNPDWAIVKHDDETLYLVRETKSTKDFLKLRTTEADKVRCGEQHFKALGMPFAVVVDDTGV